MPNPDDPVFLSEAPQVPATRIAVLILFVIARGATRSAAALEVRIRTHYDAGNALGSLTMTSSVVRSLVEGNSLMTSGLGGTST